MLWMLENPPITIRLVIVLCGGVRQAWKLWPGEFEGPRDFLPCESCRTNIDRRAKLIPISPANGFFCSTQCLAVYLRQMGKGGSSVEVVEVSSTVF